MHPRLKLAFLLIPVLFLGAALAACSDDDNGGTTQAASPTTAAAPASPTSAPAATATTAAAAPAPTQAAGGGAAATTMTIAGFAYTPRQITARAGEAVRLSVSNQDSVPHTFTIDGVVDSGTLSGGQSASVTFTPSQAGTLTFYCTVHGATAMSGQVMVQGAGGALPPPSGGQSTGASAPAPAPEPSQAGTDYGY